MHFLNFISENKSSFWEDCRILVLNLKAASLPLNYPAFHENCLGLYSRLTIIQIIEVQFYLIDWLAWRGWCQDKQCEVDYQKQNKVKRQAILNSQPNGNANFKNGKWYTLDLSKTNIKGKEGN